MDEKLRYIKKYRDLGYEIEDENGIIIFYVDRESYSKSLINDIRKIISESKYTCSWGIRPRKGAITNSKEAHVKIIEMETDNIAPFDTGADVPDEIEDDLEEEFRLQDERAKEEIKEEIKEETIEEIKKVEKTEEKTEESTKAPKEEPKKEPKKEADSEMTFTQQSLFDLF